MNQPVIALIDLRRLPPAQFDLQHPWLDALERARASRLVTVALQQRFVAAHLALRGLLATASGESAERLRITADRHGKPWLPDHPQLHFNFSHSGPWALLGVAATPLGIDIEARIERNADGLAEQITGPAERPRYAALAEAERGDWLTALWTRKEALLKAAGFGLRLAPDRFDCPPALPGWAELPAAEGLPRSRWWLQPLQAPAGFHAALASGGVTPPPIFEDFDLGAL